MDMKEQIAQIRAHVTEEMRALDGTQALESLRVKVLGKKGELTALLRGMGQLSPEERPQAGQLINQAREEFTALLDEKQREFKAIEQEAALRREAIDVTQPCALPPRGSAHPITLCMNEMVDCFTGMGFEVVEGPEVELDHYNFEMLNMPKSHPARDTQDTFYITENVLLRTQTSPMQIRTMEKQAPPIRIICPGRVYRSDAVDATHSPIFHQIEGLVVDKNITFSDLKGTLEMFIKKLYGPDTRVRFRPHHFPYTEPSAEMDMSCFKCGGKGCSLCKGDGWIEILGCGMVHPKVLESCGINPEEYSGFAFGVGLERIVMMRYGIDDMRLLYENDLRFLKQF